MPAGKSTVVGMFFTAQDSPTMHANVNVACRQKMRAINDIDVQHSPATQYTFSSSLKAECQKKTRF